MRYEISDYIPFFVMIAIFFTIVFIKFFTSPPKDKLEFSAHNSAWLKSISAFALVLHHFALVMPTQNSGFEFLRNSMGQIGTYLSGIFLFCSGYGYSQKQFTNHYLAKRIIRIIFPTYVVSFFFFYFMQSDRSLSSVMKKVLFFNVQKIGDMVDGYWFIYAILYFTVLYYVASIAKIDTPPILMFGTTLYIGICVIVRTGPWWYNSAVCFLCGALLAQNEKKIQVILKKRIAVISLLLLVGISLALGVRLKLWIGYEISTCIFCIIVYHFLSYKDIKSNVLHLIVGTNSLELYLLHSNLLLLLYDAGVCKTGVDICLIAFLSVIVACGFGNINRIIVEKIEYIYNLSR